MSPQSARRGSTRGLCASGTPGLHRPLFWAGGGQNSHRGLGEEPRHQQGRAAGAGAHGGLTRERLPDSFLDKLGHRDRGCKVKTGQGPPTLPSLLVTEDACPPHCTHKQVTADLPDRVAGTAD